MKIYNKSNLLIVCMVIFLLIGVVSANKINETISNVTTDNNAPLNTVNQSNSSSQNGGVDQINNLTKENLNSTINSESEIDNSSGNNGSFNDLQNTINNSSDNSVLDLNRDYILMEQAILMVL